MTLEKGNTSKNVTRNVREQYKLNQWEWALKEMNQSQTRNKEVLINSERNDSFK